MLYETDRTPGRQDAGPRMDFSGQSSLRAREAQAPVVPWMSLVTLVLVGTLTLCWKYGPPLNRSARIDLLQQKVSEGDVFQVDRLLADGYDVNAGDNWGNTPLMIAGAFGHGDVTRVLLARGADVSATNRVGATPLTFAAGSARHSEESIRLLLRCGADPNTPGQGGRTALMLACLNGHFMSVAILIDAGAHLHTRDQLGQNALWFAASGGDADILRLLLAAGLEADVVDTYGSTPLHDAAAQGSTRVAALLIAAGARTDRMNVRGLSPADVARGQQNLGVLELLGGSMVRMPAPVRDSSAEARSVSSLEVD